MKLSKTAVAIAILLVILIPLGAAYSQRELDYLKSMINSQPSLTVISSESHLLDAQYDEVLRQQREAKKQLILLENSADSLMSQKELTSAKKQQTLLTEEHLLQLGYFNVCLLIENDKLLKSELDLLIKQTDVEQAKLAVGNSTQNNVDLLVAAQNLTRQNIVANQAKIDAGKTSVSVKLVSHAANPDFIIPDFIDETFLPNDRNLQSSLLRNNLTMLEYDNAISNQNKLLRYIERDLGKGDAMYTEGMAELDRLMAQRELNQTQLILLSASKYSEYVVATAQYSALVSGRAALMDRLSITDTLLNNGEISELEYLNERYTIYQKLFEIKSAIVDKANLLNELDLLYNGVVVGSN